MGYTYRRRRSGPNWGAILSLLLVGAAAAYFVPQYLAPAPDGPPPSPAAHVAAAASPQPSPTADQSSARLAEADSLLRAGRWAAAATAYAEIARGPAASPVAQARWARALVFANKPAEAVEQAQKSVEADPRLAEGHVVLALAHDWAGNPDRAIISARRAIELAPDLPEAHAYLAEAFTDKYRLREAEESLERAFQAGGRDHPEVLRVQAYLQETKADYAAAVASYKRAVDRAPDFSHLHLSLGHAYRALKQYQDAIGAFQRAAELNPLDPRPEGGLGTVYYQMEEYELALGHLQRSVEIDPGYANGYGQMGWVFYVQKQYDKAQPHFERAIELEKNASRNAAYRHALGWIHLGMKRYDRAKQEFTKALELNPGLDGAKEGLQMVEQASS